MISFMEINIPNHLHKDIYRDPHKPDREAFGGIDMQTKGRTGGPLKDKVLTDLRAAGKSEVKFEPSLAHIRWLKSCDAFHELVQAVTADSCSIIQVLH
jgi:hypothetical protein